MVDELVNIVNQIQIEIIVFLIGRIEDGFDLVFS